MRLQFSDKPVQRHSSTQLRQAVLHSHSNEGSPAAGAGLERAGAVCEAQLLSGASQPPQRDSAYMHTRLKQTEASLSTLHRACQQPRAVCNSFPRQHNVK